jgi:MFS transporter, YNFM family, putative membrane transport protein
VSEENEGPTTGARTLPNQDSTPVAPEPAAGVLPLKAVSETLGRTPAMAVSLFTSAGLALLVAVSPNFTVLLVLCAFQGFALAGIQAVAMPYLAEELHRDCLGFAMGLYVPSPLVINQ